MNRNHVAVKAGPVLLLIGAAVCFAIAMADQLSSGDVYPRGSTLRTSQEGASAYFEALGKTRGDVERSYATLGTLELNNAAVLFLRVRADELENKEFVQRITSLAQAGNRVVMSFDSGLLNFSGKDAQQIKHWDLTLKKIPRKGDDDLDWPIYFGASKQWHVESTMEDDKAIAIERPFGKGSIALVASTKPFLNATLRDNRDLTLLTWAAGNQKRILFDESHLGMQQSGTIMGLMRRLRLQGFLAVLIAATLLFFWRASVPFPPVPETPEDADRKLLSSAVVGETLRNLLQRRIAPAALANACVQEWTRDFRRRAGPDVVKEVTNAAATNAPPQEQWDRIRGIVRGVGKHHGL